MASAVSVALAGVTQKRMVRASIQLPNSGRLSMSTARGELGGEPLPLTARLSKKRWFGNEPRHPAGVARSFSTANPCRAKSCYDPCCYRECIRNRTGVFVIRRSWLLMASTTTTWLRLMVRSPFRASIRRSLVRRPPWHRGSLLYCGPDPEKRPSFSRSSPKQARPQGDTSSSPAITSCPSCQPAA